MPAAAPLAAASFQGNVALKEESKSYAAAYTLEFCAFLPEIKRLLCNELAAMHLSTKVAKYVDHMIDYNVGGGM